MKTKYSHPVGASTCLYSPLNDPALAFRAYAEAGIPFAELSIRADNFDSLNLHRDTKPMKRAAESNGVTIRSLHIPFGREFDNSATNDVLPQILADTKRYVDVAASLEVPIAVIHPGCEPNLPEEREEKLKRCKDSLDKLSTYSASHGVRLAVENLPRTCLGNCAQDMLYLLDGIDALAMCFDTNHCLLQTNESFLKTISEKAWGRILTVHVSDYDFEDEKHWLPGENGGKNNWQAIMDGLEACGYGGPVMYEVGKTTPAGIRGNYDRVFGGEEK